MIRQVIEETNTRFSEAFQQRDAAAIAALYTDDTKLLPPNNETVVGKQAVQEFWNDRMKRGVQSVAFETMDFEVDGDLAYEIGVVTVTIQTEGDQAITQMGKYLVIRKRQADGSWKWAVDIWNSNAPLPAQ